MWKQEIISGGNDDTKYENNEVGIAFISESEDHWGNPHEIYPQKTQIIPFLWSMWTR